MIGISGGETGEGSFAARMRRAFSPEGLLSRSADFEYRAPQEEMAGAVAGALERGRSLIVEAGTGVGKSLAYLLPAVERAREQEEVAVISTHTINLQEQLWGKDLPLVRQLLGAEVPAALLKGQQNYLCPRRLRRALENAGELLTRAEQDELRAVWRWAEDTRDGTRSDLDFAVSAKVWSQVCSESWSCTAKVCGRRGNCFFQEARKAMSRAQVLVVNHSLFFALLNYGEEEKEEEPGLLVPNDFVVFDEAHTLEEVAADAFGLRLSQVGLRFELQRLFSPRTGKGLLNLLQAQEAMGQMERLHLEVERFFQAVEERVEFGREGRERRVREPELVENNLAEPLRSCWEAIAEVAQELEDEEQRGELMDGARRLRETAASVENFLELRDEESVYWVEKSGLQNVQITLRNAPLEVASRLRPLFFEGGKASIFTSATLGVGDRELSYFRRRVGGQKAEVSVIGSPFDYARQMKVYVVKSMPDPSASDYEDQLVHWTQRVLKKSEGRAFVLFTSYRLLQRVAQRLEDFLEERGWRSLVQGEGLSRRRLIEIFREDTHSVLFGTASFWTGVDVPGEALSNVIITRLPFSVPTHPLTQAQMEDIEARGGNSFADYSLPEAVLRFRQGVGRLIRSGRDEGMVVVLDPRVVTRSYGKKFLAALPEAPVRVIS